MNCFQASEEMIIDNKRYHAELSIKKSQLSFEKKQRSERTRKQQNFFSNLASLPGAFSRMAILYSVRVLELRGQQTLDLIISARRKVNDKANT